MKLKLQGWRAPASPAPSSIFRHPRTPRFRGARPPPPPHRPPCQRGSGDTRRRPQLCGRLLWGDPQSRQPTQPHRSPRKGFPAESGVAGLGSVARRVRVRDASWERARRRVSRSDSRLGSSALAGPPVASFPVLSPGPHRVETGYLVKRCFWPSRRRGDGRRKAPSPEFFSIKSDKKFREK